MGEPGRCRFCGCTDEMPCIVPPLMEPCAWLNRGRDVCSAPDCASAWQRETERVKAKAEAIAARQRRRNMWRELLR